MPASLYAQRSGADAACQSSTRDCHNKAPRALLAGPVGRRLGGHGLRHGFLPVPAGLRRHAAELEITPELEQTVLALLDCGHGRAVTVVTIAELAQQLHVQERAVQRRITRLLALGCLRRIRQLDDAGADLANGYDLQPLWQRLDELDTRMPEGVSCTTPPLSKRIRDLDPKEDPPTPTTLAACDGTGDTGISDLPTRGGRHSGHASSLCADPGTRPAQYPEMDDDADRAAMAAALQPVLTAYREVHPAAAAGQFLGLQQRYHLDLQGFAEALDRARQRVDQRLADAGQLGPVRRPLAYLYAVLARDLAEQAAAASSHAEPCPQEQLRAAAARLAVDLGTSQPSSAASTMLRLFRRSGLPSAVFWSRMCEAMRQVRQCDVRLSGKGGRPNALPLFLTILKRLLGGGPQPWGRPKDACRQSDVSVSAPAPAISETHLVWRQVLEHLADVLTPANFRRCLASHVATSQGGLLRIAVPGTFDQQWWTRQLHRHLQAALADCGYAGLQVLFVVETKEDLAV